MNLYEHLENAAALLRTYAERELAEQPDVAQQFTDRAEQLESYMARFENGVVSAITLEHAQINLASFEPFINIAVFAILEREQGEQIDAMERGL